MFITTTAPATADSHTPSFAEQAAAFARSRGFGPYEAPDLIGTALRQREELVRCHGGSNDPFVYPGRTVIEVPGVTWPIAHPEECPDDSGGRIWFAADGRRILDVSGPDAIEGIVLLCPQCGLDCT